MKLQRRVTRYSYWSRSAIAKWLRTKAGLTNPSALSMEGWDQHEKDCKQKAPFVHYLTDDVFDKIQDVVMFIPDYLEAIYTSYCNWKDKSHVLEGGFEVGQWVDRCTRFNTCLFYELEKFIEKEKGLDTLAWEKELVYDESWGYDETHEDYGNPTHQALAAIEQEEIYNWWKANKNRDFFEESGLAALYDTVDDLSMFSVYKGMQDNPQYDACSKLQDELESKFKQEEEVMLIRLIKLRDTLWC